MSDIQLVLRFDYDHDSQFIPPTVEQAGLVEIDPTDSARIAKECGWFTAWGKELTGIDSTQKGAFAFQGDWIFCSKNITMKQHPDHNGCLVPAEIVVEATLKQYYQDSPIVFAFALDGLRYCMLIHKQHANAQGGSADTSDLVGDWREAHMELNGAQVPYPANGNWSSVPGVRADSRKTISQQAIARNIVDVDISLKVSDQLSVGFGVLDNKNGWGYPNEVFCPIDAKGSPLTQDDAVMASMTNAGNANSGLAAMVQYAKDNGLIAFDKPVVVHSSRSAGQSTFASMPFTSSDRTARSVGVPFDPPEGLDLPDPPDGYVWALHIRNLLFLEQVSNPGVPLWPWDVFSREYYLDDKTGEFEDEDARMEWEKVKKLFAFMRDVGNGISMNAEIFGGDL